MKGITHSTIQVNTVTVKCCTRGTTLASTCATGLLSAEVWWSYLASASFLMHQSHSFL